MIIPSTFADVKQTHRPFHLCQCAFSCRSEVGNKRFDWLRLRSLSAINYSSLRYRQDYNIFKASCTLASLSKSIYLYGDWFWQRWYSQRSSRFFVWSKRRRRPQMMEQARLGRNCPSFMPLPSALLSFAISFWPFFQEMCPLFPIHSSRDT